MKNIFLAIISLIMVSFLSISYAALNTDLYINGEAFVRVDADIRIVNVELIEPTINAYENYKSEFSKDTVTLNVKLLNNTSY